MAKPPIIGHLQTRLRITLRDKSITLGEIEASTENYNIVDCLGIKYHLDDETSHRMGLLPLKIKETIYWVSISVDFNSLIDKTEHVSIIFYDEELSKMFRAEWANNKSHIIHAQPHWHIHNRKPNPESILWNPEAVDSFPEAFEELNNDKIKNIHFAMCASWNKSDPSHVEDLASSELQEIINWIEGVLVYSIQQITYLYDKSDA